MTRKSLPEENRKLIEEIHKRVAYEDGYKAGAGKQRKIICTISISIAGFFFAGLRWVGEYIFNRIDAVAAAWDTFINNGGLK